MHPYISIDTATTRKTSRFIISNRSDFYMIDNLSIAFYALARCMLSLSEDEMLLPMYEDIFTYFRLAISSGNGPFIFKTQELCFICIRVETNSFCWLRQAMYQGFSLSRSICKKRYLICIDCVHYSYCGILSAPCLFLCVKLFSFIRSTNSYLPLILKKVLVRRIIQLWTTTYWPASVGWSSKTFIH